MFYKSASKLINMIGVVNGDKYITWLSSHLLRNMSEEEIFQHDEITSDTSLATNKFRTGRHCDKPAQTLDLNPRSRLKSVPMESILMLLMFLNV